MQRTVQIPRLTRFAALLTAAAALTASGCAFLQPRPDSVRFYVLTSPSTPSARAAGFEFKRWKVGVRSVTGPAYLRGKAIVVRTGHNEIHFADFDRWAEPLDRGITRVLNDTLGSAENVESTALNSDGDEALDYEVVIRILACEGVRAEAENSSIRFALTWETWSVAKSTLVKKGTFVADEVAWNGQDYGQLAELLSEAIANASRAIAADLPTEAKTHITTANTDGRTP